MLNPLDIPAELRALRQWVGWRLVTRDGRPTKVPVNPATGQNADSTDPATWGDFATALAGVEAGRWCGVGFVFADGGPFVGIDFDKIIDPDTGEIDPAANAEIEAFDSYTESSPSGTGVHVIVRGTIPGPRRRAGNRECYSKDRFFTVTGQRWKARGIEDRQGQLAAWYAATFPDRPPATPAVRPTVRPVSLPAGDLVARIAASKQGAKFSALWAGDTSGAGGDESAADLALCSILAWWAGGDAATVDALFRQSGLMRAKWNERRGELTYGARTVKKACESVGAGGGYNPDHRTLAPPAAPPAARTDHAQPTAPAGDGWGGNKGVEVIRDYFRRAYRPAFRAGNLIHCEDGSVMTQTVACSAAPSKLIEKLAAASDAPTFRGGGVNEGALPGFFRKWAGTAWADLRDSLPQEDEAQLGADSATGEEFRRAVREALLTEVTLGDRDEDGRGLPSERLAVIEWCRRFAKAGRWASIRSKLVYCRNDVPAPGVIRLRVAIHHSLFSQLLGAARAVRDLSTDTFNRRCAQYGVGQVMRDERVGGQRLVILSDSFVSELVGMLCPQGWSADGGEVDHVEGCQL